MNILLLGKNGQVGWELQRSLAPLGTVVALDRHGIDPQNAIDSIVGGAVSTGQNPENTPKTPSHAQPLSGDLTQLDALAQTLTTLRPQVIVNAAAYTAVDKAEAEPQLARTVNALAPEIMARYAAANGALLAHYSTDYVFDGSGHRPWREGDATGPLSVYGATKLEGEQRIAASGCRHLIFRTSWVYAARGGNFAKTMLRLAQEREQLTIINDQWGAPTGAELIADLTAHAIVQTLADPAKVGLYHLAASGTTTWFDYAKHVISRARHAAPTTKIIATSIQPVATSGFKTAATRPLNSRLDSAKLQTTFGLTLPPWQQGVNRMLAEIL